MGYLNPMIIIHCRWL